MTNEKLVQEKIVTAVDISVLKWQLKTKSVHCHSIVSRCKYGYPQVILLDPYGGEESISKAEKNKIYLKALSNYLWLSCPYLNSKIHDLESEGYIGKILEFINSNKNYSRMMKNAHAHYFYMRKGLFKMTIDENSSFIVDDSIMNTGIGGIKNIEFIKCLHIHYAHYKLCSENIIGKMVYNLINKKEFCEEVTCKDASK